MAGNIEKLRDVSGRLAAEFAIVVLGVSIALWADGWVADRNDREEEAARLHALRDNVEETLADLQAAQVNAAGAEQALRSLVSISSNGRNADDNLAEVLIYGLLYGATFYPELNVYDDLKSSGEVALLTNRDLRQSLAAMDTHLEQVKIVQSDMIAVQQLNVDRYMLDHIDLRMLYGPQFGLAFDTDASQASLEFLEDAKFLNLMLLKLDLVDQVQADYDNAAGTLMDVRNAIEKQLGLRAD